MRKIFVDTSAFYALADRSDRHHPSAAEVYGELFQKVQLVTTDYVLVECWFLISRYLGREAAIKFWDALNTGIVDLVKVEPHDLRRAREIISAFPDQDFSIVDATSFAVMERLEIDKAFAFDDHFRVYRFGKRREKGFEVIP